ncbi:MAG: hypothetical protein ACTSO5_15200, partial [Candidatus Heimdallarchaeaceae archaeon]
CLLTNGLAMLGENGELKGFRGVDKDITDRKKAEEKLHQKLEELGIFHETAVNRELKMIELKKEINEICEKYGEKPRYDTNL